MSEESANGAVPSAPIGAQIDEDPSKLVRSSAHGDWDAPTPLYCVWEITLACDLGCRHCGSRAGDARPNELTTEQCLDVVHQLADFGCREVTLIGGEAYLRDDWHIIAAEITKSGMSAGMTTGARNLDDKRLQQAVDAGLRTISISIDGLEKTHDAQRGSKGAFKAAVDAARRVGESPIRLATNTQINRLSMPELPALADLLAEIGSKAWQIQLTVPMGRAADRPELLLQPYELLELFPLLVWIKQNKLTPNGIRLFPGNNIGYFGPYESLLRYGGEKGAHWASCSAGKWSIGLEADGKIKGCPSLPSDQYTGGYIQDVKIIDAVRDSEAINFIAKRTREDLWGACKTCYYADVCLAGCTWTSHVFLGRPGNNPYCIHRQMEYEKKGVRERFRKLGPAPGRPFDHGLFEVFTEPIPEPGADAEAGAPAKPTISGIDLSEVISLTTNAPSMWEKADIITRLKPS